MKEGINNRLGVRVQVNRQDGIEAVIYAEQTFPEFTDEYEINLGGLKLDSAMHCRVGEQVTISIFGQHGKRINITGYVIESENRGVVIRFTPLNEIQQQGLSKVLELQQAL